jgi:S1-C subfamily serine protease
VGTGFIVSPDGDILTAHHVVSGAKDFFVHCPNIQSHAATLVKVDISNDLAVLHLSEPTPNYLPFAVARSAKTGDKVFTMGFPVPDLLGQESKYSEGVISALSGPSGAASFLQISIPVQPGNSGGPVLNQNGQVVGIVTAVAAIQPFFQATGTLPQNINWAVKAEYARLLIETHESLSVPTNPELIIEKVRKSVCLVEAQRG